MTTYWETRYLGATNKRPSRIRVIGAGSGLFMHTAAFNYAAGGGLDQHLNAISETMTKHLPDCATHAKVAFATKRGYVFAIEMGEYA